VSDGSLEPLLITFSLVAENINLFTASECLISFLYFRICCKPLSDCPATWNNIQECPVSQQMLDSLMWPNLRKASTYSGQRHQALLVRSLGTGQLVKFTRCIVVASASSNEVCAKAPSYFSFAFL
jgi:hypothetical protein